MREEVTHNKVYPQFQEFSNAMREFFDKRVSQLRQVLRRRINDNFQKIHINPPQTSIR